MRKLLLLPLALGCVGLFALLSLPVLLTTPGQCIAGPGDLTSATSTIAGVRGRPVGFAIADDRGAVLVEHNGDAAGNGRSMSKALVLVALLRAARDRPLTAAEASNARSMITVSDNAAANALVRQLGLPALNAAARAAGMTSWRAKVGSTAYMLGVAQATARDFAVLFARVDALVPRRHRGLARELLSSITGMGRFGALSADLPAPVLSKGGWMEETPGAWTVNQAAQVTVDGRRYGLAVVLGEQPTFAAGAAAIADAMAAGVAALSSRGAAVAAPQPGGDGGLIIRAPDGSVVRLHRGQPYTGPDFRASATAYGPPWNSFQGYGITKSGIDLPDGPMDVMIPIVAVSPGQVGEDDWLYAWPNPYDYSGPFLAADIGGWIDHNEVDFLVMQGRHAQFDLWGRKDILVSARPIPAAARGRPALGGAVDAAADCGDQAPVQGGPLVQRMIDVARAELKKGVTESPPGSNCVPYFGVCDYWCASFLTWVWQRAGVDIPHLPFTGDVYTWAEKNGTVLRPTQRPSPGDAVLYGTGPQSTSTSKHIGMVEQVLADGRIVTIEGNLSDRVKRNGPFWPRDAIAAGEPGPIYGYARAYRGTV